MPYNENRCRAFIGAGDRARTGDVQLGKMMNVDVAIVAAHRLRLIFIIFIAETGSRGTLSPA